MIFDICNKNYYAENNKLYKADKIELLENNVYVLTGCNGIGKSTLIFQITEGRPTSLKNFACNLLNNYNESNTFSSSIFSISKKRMEKDYDTFYLSINNESNVRSVDMFESKLFSISQSHGKTLIYNIVPYLEILYKEMNRLKDKTLYLFLDDLDIGKSADVILEERMMIENLIKKLKENNTKYIICIAANNYGLTKLGTCIDCMTLKPIEFKNYDDYIKYVIKTRIYKDTRNKEN